MHYPGGHLLPGPKFITELLPPCQPHPEPFANTCHPLSVTKSPAPRWCPQSATTATTAATTSLLPCQPLVQPCLLLCQEPCETSRLLPIPGGFGAPQTLRVSGSGDKKRAARSLPPCAPRCPEPRRLRFPPCGVRGSSASCRGQCRSHKVAKWPLSYPEPGGGYSVPLRGVTECPPQRHPLLQGYLGTSHWCSKGYPTQELLGCCSSEQRLSSAGGVVKGAEEGPQVRVVTKECPQVRAVGKGTQECPPLRGVTKECPPPRVVTKECPPVRAVTKECPPTRVVTKECPPPRVVTKECPSLRAVTKECSPTRVVTKECPPLRVVTKECPHLRTVTKGAKECPPLRAVTKECPHLRTVTKGAKECPPLRAVTKGSGPLEVTKGRSRCCPQHPRGPPRPSRLAPGGSKRCGHAKKNRCASKWLW